MGSGSHGQVPRPVNEGLGRDRTSRRSANGVNRRLSDAEVCAPVERRRERWWPLRQKTRTLTADQLVFAIDVFQNSFWVLSCSLKASLIASLPPCPSPSRADLSGTKPFHHFFSVTTGFPPIDGPPGAFNRAKRARAPTEYELPADWVDALTLSCVATRKNRADVSLELSAAPCRAWFVPSQGSFPAAHCIQFRGRLHHTGASSAAAAGEEREGVGAQEQQPQQQQQQQGFSEEFVCTLEARERFGSVPADNQWHVVKLSAQLGGDAGARGGGGVGESSMGLSSRWGRGGEYSGSTGSVDMQGSNGQASHRRSTSSLLPWSFSGSGSGSGRWGRSRSISGRG
ncbi:unnamed protein product [Closterium sp. NIES-53]